mgnify:FL=1
MYTNLTIKKLPNSEVEIKGDIPFEEIIIHKKNVLRHASEHIKIDGFREGHIPEKILEKHIGEMALLAEMAEIAIAKAYPKIIYEHKIFPISRPNITFTKLATNNPLGFIINITVMPEIKLPDYKEIAKNENKKTKPDRLLLLEAIIKETEMEVPNILIESELNKMIEQLKAEIAGMGGTLEKYLEHAKKTEKEMRNAWNTDAKKRVKIQLILNKISFEEKIETSKEEIEKEVTKIMAQYKDANPDRVKDYVEMILVNEKVLKFLEEQK